MRGRLAQDKSAVTSPLGTAITIGITIALAVGLTIMVRVFVNTDEERATPVTFIRAEDDDTLQVTHAEEEQLRSSYEIRMSVAGDLDIGQGVTAGPDALLQDQFAPLGGASGGPADGTLATGAIIHLCAVSAAPNVDVHIRHAESNTMVWNGEFLNLAACPA